MWQDTDVAEVKTVSLATLFSVITSKSLSFVPTTTSTHNLYGSTPHAFCLTTDMSLVTVFVQWSD